MLNIRITSGDGVTSVTPLLVNFQYALEAYDPFQLENDTYWGAASAVGRISAYADDPEAAL